MCVDTDSAALEIAKKRADDEGLTNIVFHACDFHRYETPIAFDAVIGRCILLHQAEPLDALQAVLNHLRSGGIVAFQEPWFSRAFSCPEAPLFQEMLGWLHGTLAASGFDGDIGVRLPSLYVSVGLPRPRLSFEMLVEYGPESEIYDFCTDTVRSLLLRIEELGVSTAEKIQLDTLASRLRMEAEALDTVIRLNHTDKRHPRASGEKKHASVDRGGRSGRTPDSRARSGSGPDTGQRCVPGLSSH
jgi:SAM-dependent methyltransferase